MRTIKGNARASSLILATEDEEADDLDDTDEDLELNKAFVSSLFDEIDDLRMQVRVLNPAVFAPLFIGLSQLFEAEMRCAITEAETREEVMEEMEERMRNMEKMYLKRITDEVKMNERKMDAKIDMLHRSGLLGSGGETEEEEYVSNALTRPGPHSLTVRRVKRRITFPIICLKTMSMNTRNGHPLLWIASLPLIDHKNYP